MENFVYLSPIIAVVCVPDKEIQILTNQKVTAIVWVVQAFLNLSESIHTHGIPVEYSKHVFLILQ